MSDKSISNRVKDNSKKDRQKIYETIKNDKGISLASFILIVLILILICFLVYEIVYVDIFNIMTEESELNVDTNVLTNEITQTNTITNVSNGKVSQNTEMNHTEINSQNVETYVPVNEKYNSNTTLISDKYYYNQLVVTKNQY